MTFPPYLVVRNRAKATMPPCRALKEEGKAALPPYGEPSGFFERFLPRNGLMLKASNCSLSAP